MIRVSQVAYAVLLAESTITAIVGAGVNARIFVDKVPDSVTKEWEAQGKVQPSILIVTRRGDEYDFESPVVTAAPELQCISTNSENASVLAGAVYDALKNGQNISADSSVVRQVWFTEPPPTDEDPKTEWKFVRLLMNMIILKQE